MDHALMIVGFYEAPEEERPPARIWKHPELLSVHWDTVQARRRANSSGMAPIDDDGGEELQSPVSARLRR